MAWAGTLANRKSGPRPLQHPEHSAGLPSRPSRKPEVLQGEASSREVVEAAPWA